jgi:hypothetical protein
MSITHRILIDRRLSAHRRSRGRRRIVLWPGHPNLRARLPINHRPPVQMVVTSIPSGWMDGPIGDCATMMIEEPKEVMLPPRTPAMAPISYLSLSKLEQIYSSMFEYDDNKLTETTASQLGGKINGTVSGLLGFLTGGLEATGQRQMVQVKERSKNSFHKLAGVLAHFHRSGKIVALDDCIQERRTLSESAIYMATAEFSVFSGGKDEKYIREEKQKEDRIKVYHYDIEAVSSICVLKASLLNFDLRLACSLKYFCEMGSSRIFGQASDEDKFRITPHSGNYFFFDGAVPCEFTGLFYISQQKENILYGSPLVLFQSFVPRFDGR